MTEPVVPGRELAVVQRWCRNRVPGRVLHQVRVEAEISGRDITLVECRAPWNPDDGPDWTRVPVARLRYLRSRGVWRLYWRDRDGHWREYPGLPFAQHVDDLLREVDDDPTALFWG